MTSEAMSPLRRRMIEDMMVRKFLEKTQKDYIRYVKDLTAFLGRSPNTATVEDLRHYQLHLTNNGAHPPRINATVSALRFFRHGRPSRGQQTADVRGRAAQDPSCA
jgi:integrase/recombinase XerD